MPPNSSADHAKPRPATEPKRYIGGKVEKNALNDKSRLFRRISGRKAIVGLVVASLDAADIDLIAVSFRKANMLSLSFRRADMRRVLGRSSRPAFTPHDWAPARRRRAPSLSFSVVFRRSNMYSCSIFEGSDADHLYAWR
jgi:hypothetical protein